jgi:putative secretion ATPase (PEP-CTERM system associated)
MYEAFYGLKEKPFRIVPDPGYLYLSEKHRQALTYLEYGLMEDVGFILLTGEVGAGKTTLIRHILGRLEKDILTAVVFNTNFSASEIVDRVVQSFDMEPRRTKTESLERLYAFLIEKYAEGKRVLLIIDEAQNLSGESLEEVRMLSNLQSEEKSLLQIMLVGQPELRDRLKRPELASFAQRIAVQYHIYPLSREEMGEYIAHRLAKAGGRHEIFEPEAVEMIFQASAGIPRTVNLLCDAALVYGFGYELNTIGTRVIEQVIRDKGGMGIAGGDLAEGESGRAGTCWVGDGLRDGAAEISARVEALEKGMAVVMDRLERHVLELEKRADASSDGMIRRLKELLLFERERSDRLLVHYTRLRTRYKDLVDRIKTCSKMPGGPERRLEP